MAGESTCPGLETAIKTEKKQRKPAYPENCHCHPRGWRPQRLQTGPSFSSLARCCVAGGRDGFETEIGIYWGAPWGTTPGRKPWDQRKVELWSRCSEAWAGPLGSRRPGRALPAVSLRGTEPGLWMRTALVLGCRLSQSLSVVPDWQLPPPGAVPVEGLGAKRPADSTRGSWGGKGMPWSRRGLVCTPAIPYPRVGPTAVSTGNLLEMHGFWGPTTDLLSQKFSGWGLAVCFNKLPRWFWCNLKSESLTTSHQQFSNSGLRTPSSSQNLPRELLLTWGISPYIYHSRS